MPSSRAFGVLWVASSSWSELLHLLVRIEGQVPSMKASSLLRWVCSLKESLCHCWPTAPRPNAAVDVSTSLHRVERWSGKRALRLRASEVLASPFLLFRLPAERRRCNKVRRLEFFIVTVFQVNQPRRRRRCLQLLFCVERSFNMIPVCSSCAGCV